MAGHVIAEQHSQLTGEGAEVVTRGVSILGLLHLSSRSIPVLLACRVEVSVVYVVMVVACLCWAHF